MSSEKAKAVKENFLKTCRRQPHDHIPVMPRCGTSLMAYAGTNFWEIGNDKEAIRAALAKAFDDGIPVDCLSSAGLNLTPEIDDLFRGCGQTRLTADGVTLQHLQASFMKDDEYEIAMKDLNGYILDTLVPRKMPFLFEGTAKDAAKILERVVDIKKELAVGPQSGLPEWFEERYGTFMFGSPYSVQTPGDFLFDYFRGFKGTLTDLRRHYQEMQDMCDVLWEQMAPNYTAGLKVAQAVKDGSSTEKAAAGGFDPDKCGLYMSHIPCFLNPKQHYDLCFKYFLQNAREFDKVGSHIYVLAEGKWAQLFDQLRDLPQDVVLLNVEDDDVIDAYKALGDCQVLIGGSKLVTTKMCSAEEAIAQAKKSIDVCAGSNAFIFATDKSWSCKGDITPTLVETFKWVGENGKY